MYHFLQFNPNKKEAWRLYDEKQLADLPQPPAFITVLRVDQDPENYAENGEDPLDHVKYLGPMYFDFDGADLDEVLDSVRAVLDALTRKLDISKDYIHCWLSGQKGVHITVPEQVFGIKGPMKALPLIYREVAATFKAPCLDMNVYSAGRGRMWRCENIARPGTGTFKVGTTVDELMDMDAEQYEVLVASARPPLARATPPKNVIHARAESILKTAKAAALQKIKAMKSSTVVPKDALREYGETPGCVLKLITEGDCESSNWNQAAMQVAAYIAARYERAEEAEYTQDVIDPFIENVESSSRPSTKERRKHVQEQLNRAFSGRIKLLPGPLIATIGTPCGACPICRSDLAEEPGNEEAKGDAYDSDMRIRAAAQGYLHITDNGVRQLTTFTFWPHTEIHDLEDVSTGEHSAYRESARKAMVGTLVDDEGVEVRDLEVDEGAWKSRRGLMDAFAGYGTSVVLCSDADTQRLLKAIRQIARNKAPDKELEKMVRTNLCGMLFDRQKGKIIPHYIEDAGACSSNGTHSKYFYAGDPKQSPKLLEESYPLVNDTELELAIEHLCNVNLPESVAAILGWHVACHFREHIQIHEAQFPLLNISGNAQAGKTSLAILTSFINGMDYERSDFLNVEVSTIFPLIKFVSSSSTVPRLVEEVNPANMQAGMYSKVLGIFKAAWNRAPVPRGKILDKEVKVSNERVSSPIVYTSEQTATVPSLRSRTVEVKLTARALNDPAYRESYKEARSRRFALLRMAKALVTKALSTSPTQVQKIFEEMKAFVPDRLGPRPQWSYQVTMTGLVLLAETMDEYQVKGREHVDRLLQALKDHLVDNASEMEKEKSVSEVDRVLAVMNLLAEEPDDRSTGLRAGDHYWRQGNSLFLVIGSCLPRYCRYSKALGDVPVIKEARQMTSLLEGEVYFDRKEQHPTREGVEVHVINIDTLRSKGTPLTNFQDGTEPSEN